MTLTKEQMEKAARARRHAEEYPMEPVADMKCVITEPRVLMQDIETGRLVTLSQDGWSVLKRAAFRWFNGPTDRA